jgi:hypothetical protein
LRLILLYVILAGAKEQASDYEKPDKKDCFFIRKNVILLLHITQQLKNPSMACTITVTSAVVNGGNVIVAGNFSATPSCTGTLTISVTVTCLDAGGTFNMTSATNIAIFATILIDIFSGGLLTTGLVVALIAITAFATWVAMFPLSNPPCKNNTATCQ